MQQIFIFVENLFSREICAANKTILMCPQCDRNCDFWELQETCKSSKMNYLIDNNVTVVFALVMCIWGKEFNVFL